MSRSIGQARARVAPIFATTLLLLALAGCQGATPIRKLLNDPGLYEGKTVRIAGRVTASMGLLNYGAYRVDDGTAQIAVVTKVGGAPRQEAKVGVEGIFHSAFTIGTETVAAIEETRRKSKGGD